MAAANRFSADIGTPALAKLVCRGWLEFTPEIQAAWDRFRTDRNPADFKRLVEHHAPMVLHIASREKKRLPAFYRDGVDELVSTGLAALIRWILRSPDTMSVASVVFWAKKVIRTEMQRATFRANRLRQLQSLDAEPADESLPLSQMVAIDTPAPFKPLLDAEFNRLLMRGTSPRDKKILRLLMRGDNGAEIGKVLGVTRQRAHQLMDRLFETLRNRPDLAAYRIGTLPSVGNTEHHSRGASVGGLHQGMRAVQDPQRFLRAG
jgi:RNA polymerase sigma factor (sigma-70 family)